MSVATVQSNDLKALYEQDETAWLELSARLIRESRLEELDYENLSEFLEAMAKRDRREVESRLAVLLAHILKWTYQPDKRRRGWRATVESQRHELSLLLRSGTLRNHAEAELERAYQAGVRQATAETGIDPKAFPQQCPYSVQQLLEIELPTENA
jgi:hypothetical protein